MNLIVLNNASYSIGSTEILKDINLRSDHQRIGVVGRNGSGKSTLARLLCGLVAPTSGTISIADIDVAHDRYNAIRTVGMLFQNPDHQIIFPTVEEELVFGLRQLDQSQEDAQSAARNILEKFKCAHWASLSVSTLSQGQRHLVCLMAVLLMKPRVVVLDEPYAGLDIPTTMQLKKHLEAIDSAIVHISHDPEMLREYEYVLWLEQGEIVAEGEAAETLQAFSKRMQQLGNSLALV